MTYNTGVNGVASVLQANGYAYSYIITGDASAELKIILGGAGGQYTASGVYESAAYYVPYRTAFNGFTATVAKPNLTDITMQIAVANAINNSCTGVNFTYLGPNGSSNQSFQVGSDPEIIQGTIPLLTNGSYVNPGQCIKYKFALSTTENTVSPELYDITINYSP